MSTATRLHERIDGLPQPIGAAAYKHGPYTLFVVGGVLTVYRRVRVKAKKDKFGVITEAAYNRYDNEGPAQAHREAECRDAWRDFMGLSG